MVTLSIIVATGGRRTLVRTLKSVVSQLEPGDEVLILRDATGDWGHSARNDVMPRARGSYLAFIDDDDVYVPGALAKMRRFAEENPGRIGIFKMEYAAGNHLWVDPVLRYQNVSTQMFVVPNVPGKLGRWERKGRVAGDFRFMEATAKLQGDPVFVDELIARVRPQNPLRRTWTKARYRAALRTRARRVVARFQRTRRAVGPT